MRARPRPYRVMGMSLGKPVVESDHDTVQQARDALAAIQRTCAPFIRDSFWIDGPRPLASEPTDGREMPDQVNVIILRKPDGSEHASFASVATTVPWLLREVLLARGVSPDRIEMLSIGLDEDVSYFLEAGADLMGKPERMKLRIQDALSSLSLEVADVVERARVFGPEDDLPQEVIHMAIRPLRTLKHLEKQARQAGVEVPDIAVLQRQLGDAMGLEPREEADSQD